MRLITKSNLYFGIILIVMMLSVFVFTLYFFQKELEASSENSLRVSYEGFKITLDTLANEQQLKSVIHTKRDVIALATRDRLYAVLNYYLNLAAVDYNLDLMEVTDPGGRLLANQNRSFENSAPRLNLAKSSDGTSHSYLAKRGETVYWITTTPIRFEGGTVGYLNVGTRFDQKLLDYFFSILHNDVLLYADNQFLIGNARPVALPATVAQALRANSARIFFTAGAKIGSEHFDYLFFVIPGDGSFTGMAAIAKNRNEISLALSRLKIFLVSVIGLGLIFGFFGSNLLAQNIKQSIFGMEPDEIAALLDQRTTILQSTFEGIIALDQQGKITLINKEAQQILPSRLEMVGKPAIRYFPESYIKKVLHAGQAFYNQQRVIGESVIVYNIVPIKTKGEIQGAVITLRDLTEFQRVAEELVEVKNYTQALRAQSHEFMNKLQSLSGLIQLGRYDTALALLHETTESHQDLISYLTEAFAGSAAVSGILLGKFNRARELGIHFEIDRESHVPAEINIPDNEMVCIVGNLIENAFEALRESQQPQKSVRVKITPVRSDLRIAIIDNGPGIPAAIHHQIFKRGFTTKQGQNKGIGLSLVKQCVEHLHGKIQFRSRGQTIFIARIPIRSGG